jgi:2-polyprenyl-6-hydroxyphenyl methylase/3-demethylubiquinone-9 3-methyltransferase
MDAFYRYNHASLGHHHAYILPIVERVIATERTNRIFDLGCGNGSTAAYFAARGYEVAGVDPSEDGIAFAKETHPDLRLEIGSAYDDLASRFGTFPCVISLEVVEHLYSPRHYARTITDLLEPGGVAVISTPYHGYLKNIALAVSGKMEGHFAPLWDHGHIKFWSIRTLGQLFIEVGLRIEALHRVGRIPAFAKSMVCVARKP